MKNYGQPLEELWPYNPTNMGLTYKPSYEAQQNAKNNKISYDECLPISIEAVQGKLLLNYAIISGVYLFEEFFKPRSGFIDSPKRASLNYGGHAILIVGWDLYQGTFIIKNSWGTTWGVNGYGYLSFDYFLKHTIDVWSFKVN